MAWIYLVIAGILEVCWSLGLKYTEGFTRPVPSLLTALAIIISMLLLGKSTQSIPIGTAYPVWVGIGAAGAALGGIWFFQESASPLRLMFLVLLLISIVGLKLTSGNS